MTIKIKIAGIAGIDAAVLEANPIALVIGKNGAGKTTIAQAVGAALCGNPLMRGIAQKNRLNAVVRGGFDTGQVSLHGPNGAVAMEWPDGKMKTKGNPPQANEIAAGKTKLSGMGDDDRVRFLTELLGALPTREDLEKALDGWTAANIDKVWKGVSEDNGWDFTWKKSGEAGSNLKGQWQGVTKVNYGKAKAASWAPENWDDDLEGQSLDRLEREWVDAKAALEGDVGTVAVTKEKAAELKKWADYLPRFEGELAGFQEDLAAAQEKLDVARAERAKLPDVEVQNGLPCPHGCKGRLIGIKEIAQGQRCLVAITPQDISDADKKARRKAIAGADGTVARIEGVMSEAEKSVAQAEQGLQRAKNSRAALENASVGAKGAQEKTDKTREAGRVAEQRVRAFEAKKDADSLHKRVERNQELIDVLAIGGLRKTCLEAALEAFNTVNLAPVAKTFGLPPVTLDDNLVLRMGSRPHGMLSAGEQFAVDAVAQMAIATMTAADMVVVDGAEVLAGERRSGLMKMLAKAKLPAVVCVALKNREAAPDLARTGHGTTYWVENATVEPVDSKGVEK